MSSTKRPASKDRVAEATSTKADTTEAVPSGAPVPAIQDAPPIDPSPDQLALERQTAARQRLADHVLNANRQIASDIGAARQRLAELQARAWKLGLERRRLVERIAEIDLDLREAEKAEKIEEGAIEAYVRAQARVQPPPDLA